jgi:hypothetical protein
METGGARVQPESFQIRTGKMWAREKVTFPVPSKFQFGRLFFWCVVLMKWPCCVHVSSRMGVTKGTIHMLDEELYNIFHLTFCKS